MPLPPTTNVDLAKGHFRLFEIRPGEWDDALKGGLLEADRFCRYTALSYTWGSQVTTKEITVDGSVKLITTNLDLALRTIRLPDRPVIVWADALCIVQDNTKDKSEQVNMMHQIFSWAANVRAYIGSSLDRSQANYDSQLQVLAAASPFRFSDVDHLAWPDIHGALTLLESQGPAQLSPHERCMCVCGLLRALSSESLRSELMRMSLFSGQESDDMEMKLRHLFEWLRAFIVAPWWNRMWIVQEVAAARELSLIYGKITIPFQALSGLVTELKRRPLSLPSSGHEEHAKVINLLVSRVKTISELRRFEQFRSIADIRDLGYFQRSLGSPLLWLLRTFRHKFSSEPRDKIYALSQLLGRLGTPSASKIETDYNTSPAVLFSRLTVRLMHETGLFWITSPDLVAKSRDNLPSWVPNWADGFSRGEVSDMPWKIRLCHNASKMLTSCRCPDSAFRKMEPLEYYRNLANVPAASSWVKLKGSRYEHTEKFVDAGDAGRDLLVANEFIHLDYENTVDRRIQYSYYQPRLRDITKVENCLKIPALFCSVVKHVSDPVETDLTNLSTIVDGIELAMKDMFPDDWNYRWNMGAIGVALCFGVVFEGRKRVRAQLRSEESDLGIFMHLLMAGWGNDPTDQEHFGDLYRHNQMDTVVGACRSCRSLEVGERPCEDCIRKIFSIAIPPPADLCNSKLFKQLRQTALYTAPGNRLVVNEDGTVALCPAKTEAGDHIFMLTGSLCPYVLHREASLRHLGHRAFTLVGDCFLGGRWPHWEPPKLETLALV